MERFRARVAVEGSKRGLRITVPQATVKRLDTPLPGWMKLHIIGFDPQFVFARKPPSRSSVDISLPNRIFPPDLYSREIEATIENASLYRAPVAVDPRRPPGFDWLPLVTEHYFPTETVDGKLLLHNRYEEPFVMRRVTPIEPTYRMLGLYQAEGSKSAGAPDFMMATTNPQIIRHTVKLLGMWGLGPERLSLEICRPHKTSPKAARVEFECGVEVVAERFRSTQSDGNNTVGVLHVRKSKPLLRLVTGALVEHVFKSEFPSKEAAREYALGWLDGDGTITRLNNTTVELRLAGLPDEHQVLRRALDKAFDWSRKDPKYNAGSYTTNITLRAFEMLQLLEAGAFLASMSRVRLLLAFDERTTKLRNGVKVGAFARWGLHEDGELTERGEEICRGHERLLPEIEKARQLNATAPHLFGVKGVPNPL
jgi:hypothetical protein